jgi:hypothetical protein
VYQFHAWSVTLGEKVDRENLRTRYWENIWIYTDIQKLCERANLCVNLEGMYVEN